LSEKHKIPFLCAQATRAFTFLQQQRKYLDFQNLKTLSLTFSSQRLKNIKILAGTIYHSAHIKIQTFIEYQKKIND
jgi:hypothetical protein